MLLEARDDGQGFEPTQASGESGGMGLSNLRERARALGGSVELRSAPGQGTTVRIHVPLIEPLRLSPEEAARQATVAATRRAGERWVTSALSMLQIAGALVIFGAPFWADALAFIGACALLAPELPLRREVSRLAGPNSVDELALRHRAIEVSAWLLMLLALGPWYALVVAPHVWQGSGALAGTAVASALLLALGLWQWERWRRTTGRYYRLLAPRPRRQAIQQRWNETVGMAVTLGIIIVVAPFVGGWSPAFPPRTLAQWTDTASLGLLALVCTFTAIELSLNQRWRREMSQGE